MREHRDLRLVSTAAVACALLALAMPVEALSLLFAAPLAFCLTGYAIVAAIFVRTPLPLPQRLTLSVGLSLTTLALGTVVLSLVPGGGLRASGWAILLVAVVLAACRAAALRRRAGEAWRLSLPALGAMPVAAFSAAVLIVAGALVLTYTSVPADRAVGYTELWMLPYEGPATQGVQIGVGNNEQEPFAYRLRVRLGSGEALGSRTLVLDPGENRVYGVPVAPAGGRAQRRVVAVLDRDIDGELRPYRRVSGWTSPGAPR